MLGVNELSSYYWRFWTWTGDYFLEYPTKQTHSIKTMINQGSLHIDKLQFSPKSLNFIPTFLKSQNLKIFLIIPCFVPEIIIIETLV